MIRFTLFIALFISLNSLGQTSVISSKSHSGDLALLTDEIDNFGEVPVNRNPPDFHERLPVDTYYFRTKAVILIDEGCYVQFISLPDSTSFQDTLCNVPYFELHGYNKQAATEYFGEGVQLEGFQDAPPKILPSGEKSYFWSNGGPFQNGTTGFIGLILLSILAYTITPILKKK